jgi:outer membrane protein OmpA-like peptidoglycan-associated protein
MPKKIALLAFNLFLSAAYATPEECGNLERAFRKTLEQDQIDAAKTQLQNLEVICPGSTQVKSAERYFTDVIARKANDLVNQNRLPEAETLLDQAKTLSWSVSTVRGDIAAKCKNWKEAAQQYGQAFELLTDPTHTNASEIPNLRDLQEHIYKLATDAQLMYGKLDASVTRGGKPQGILLAASRGFSVEKTALPVHFDTGKASLASDGVESAEALANFILGQTETGKITLIGFADPRGSDKHNLELSQQRAQTIADYLQSKGINLSIKVMGKGESEPPKTVLENLTQEEQYALWRRVELQFDK